MNINNLSKYCFYFLKVQENHEELLKKRITNPTFNEELLLKYNIIPIVSLNETSLLGEGGYSKVYEVSYKGKHAVAKITDSENDFNMILALNDFKSSLGEDAKHIAEVYDYFIHNPNKSENQEDEFDKSYEPDLSNLLYIMVIEKLNPLSSNIKNMLKPSLLYNEIGYWTKIKNYNKSSYDQALIKIKNIISRNITSILNRTYNIDQEISKQIIDIFNKSNSSKEFSDDASGAIFEYIKKQDFIINNNYKYADIKQIASRSSFEIKNYFEDIDFTPKFYDMFEEGNIKIREETQHFIDFLLKLKKDYGIEFNDLHMKNIMERPSTRDLVISDPGLFEIT